MHLDAGIGASRGDAVLALLERAKVLPLPPFYKLCYDYLAGVRTLDTIRAAAIIEAPASSRPAAELLYQDFVAPYETDETVGKVVSTMLERIGVLEQLIIDSQEANRSQAVDLADATQGLQSDDMDAKLLSEWIGRLKSTNQSLRQANEALSSELDHSAGIITAAHDELSALKRSVALDALTGIANRSGVDQALVEVLPELERSNARMCLAIVDIDHFKKLNDSYGHQLGDEILRMVSRALVTATRENDIVGRMGGDEFIVIIRDEDLAGARIIAERVRRNIVDCDLAKLLGKGVLGNVTASIGIAQFQRGETIASLYERADRCLFEAKSRGRNQVYAEVRPARTAAA